MRRLSPAHMDPLGRAVYFGELCGALAMLEVRGAYSSDGTDAMLVGQGLPRDVAHTLRHAATAVARESQGELPNACSR